MFHLKLKLSDFCKDSSSILSGEINIFGDDDEVIDLHHRDELYVKLFEDSGDCEFEVLTQQALEVIFHAILIILERQCIDQLPGGDYWHASDKIQKAAANVPTTNMASESDFAIIDLLIRTKPNASVQTIQALTMWSRNKTSSWLDCMSDEERENVLSTARENVMKMKNKYKERKIDLKEKKMKRLEIKQKIKKDAEEKASLKKASAVNGLVSLNVQAWLNVKEAEEHFQTISDNALKRKVAQAQLDFYRFVMNVKCPVNLFYKTKTVGNKRVNLTVDELFEHLKLVITTCHLPEPSRITDKLKSKDQREEVVKNQKAMLFEKLKNARLLQVIKQQKSKMLPGFLSDPYTLVDKCVRHKIRETDEEEYMWCKGHVKSVSKEVPNNPKKTLYDVVYESEPNDSWIFPLLVDFEKGDLIIL